VVLAATLTVEEGVVGKDHKAALREFIGVDARALLFDTTVRWADDNPCGSSLQVAGLVEVGDESTP
jgi:hypothetical protein